MVWMIDTRPFVQASSGREVASYAHPLFWAPFILVGDGAAEGKP
jgi:CHAT domain-containing protein